MKSVTETAQKVKPKRSSGLIAVVRIRGKVGVRETIARTFKMLNLHKKNWCVVVPGTPEMIGMVQKVKDYCTFGEIDNATFAKLIEQRGRLPSNKPLTPQYLDKAMKVTFDGLAMMIADNKTKLKDIPGVKPYFKLKPPVGGFERRGVRYPYSSGGAAGYRGREISKLILKML